MDLVKKFEPLWLVLMMLVALNWAVAALFDTNVISEVLGSGTLEDIVYVAAGIGALTFVPKLMDELHIGRPGAHPRGA